MEKRMSRNPYLDGNFAPVSEERTDLDLPITGTLPPELGGRLLRIGPNPVAAEDPDAYHWFTGTGMVHGVRITDGRADWYRNRFVRSNRVTDALGESPLPGPSHGPSDGTANTHVIGHAGTTLALVEAGAFPVELSYELDSVCRTNLAGSLPGSFSAHTKRDPETGELHLVSYYWEWDHIKYMVVGTDGLVRRIVEVEMPGSPMVHDCAITASQVILFDLPCTFNLDAAMAGEPLPYRWNPDHAARVGLLGREGTDVQWCELDDPCYVYHSLNAHDETDGCVTIDVVRHPKTFATDLRGPNEGDSKLERWTLDPSAGKVRTELLSDIAQEFPRHDERLIGQPIRYGYATELPSTESDLEMGGLLKHDLAKRTTERWDLGPRYAAMEPVFVPRSNDAAEDDGWVMVYVHDKERNACDVVIIDAQDFTGEPVATIHLPARVPFGFHGNWVPDAVTSR